MSGASLRITLMQPFRLQEPNPSAEPRRESVLVVEPVAGPRGDVVRLRVEGPMPPQGLILSESSLQKIADFARECGEAHAAGVPPLRAVSAYLRRYGKKR